MSIFKAYDIRGVYPVELDEETTYKIARALATFSNAKRIAVGGDNRLSTPSLKSSFIKGLMDSGVEVTDIGVVPTSMVYFACYKLGFDSAAMITASHNPKEFNGIKICGPDGLAIGLENGLDKIKEIMEKNEFKSGNGSLIIRDIYEEYKYFITSLVSNRFNGVKIVIDGSNGSAGIIYSNILRSLGADVAELFCEPDGSFPNHSTPDPLIEENLKSIKNEVKSANAKIGFALDGDGDRIVVIDENGQRVSPNHMLCIFAEDFLQKNKGGKIVYDVLSSQLVEDVIKKNNGTPVVSRVGHSIIPRVCKAEGASLAGEVSSHFYFKEAEYTDDTLIAAVKLLDILKHSNKDISEMIEKYPKYHQMLEKRVPIHPEKKFQFIENLKIKLEKEGYMISTLDGIKIRFKNGWAVFRASNTESKIAISYESADESGFKEIEKFVNDIVETIPKEGDDVKAIIFDCEKVLVPNWLEIFDLPGLDIPKSSIAEFFNDHTYLRKDLQYGKLSEDEFWKRLIKISNARISVDDLKSAVRRKLVMDTKVIEIAKSLKRNKYKLFLLSNFTREWAEYLVKEYKINEIFDYMFWSFDNAIKKPSPEAYLQITEKFGLKPSECLFIDDKERNVDGARMVGMKAFVYTDSDKLKRDLSGMGVKMGG